MALLLGSPPDSVSVGDSVMVAALVVWNDTLIVIAPRRVSLKSTASFPGASAVTITVSPTPTANDSDRLALAERHCR